MVAVRNEKKLTLVDITKNYEGMSYQRELRSY